MSSVKLPTPPAEAGALLGRAFVDVCENSFFAFVETCPPEKFAALASQPEGGASPRPSPWIKASVGFTGTFAGAVEVALPEPLAINLVTALVGEEIECAMPEHWLFDGVGEFANMICGAWLTMLSNAEAFELRPPAVTRMNAGWSPASEAADDERAHRLVVNDFPVRIRFRALAG